MKKLLVVDDDAAMRGLIRMRLAEQYEVFDTGDPEQALALALEHNPDAVLLDLRMPKFSGLELRNSFHALSRTSHLPIFVISGEAGTEYKDLCDEIGVAAFFEKPIDFSKLREKLSAELGGKRAERRCEARVLMRVALKLRGVDSSGKQFEEFAETENVSANGLLCSCSHALVRGTSVDVYRTGPSDRYVGLARVVREDSARASSYRYGLRFMGKVANWVLQNP